MARYKWESAQEWLLEKAQEHASANDTAGLLSIISSFVPKLDDDTIQDEFQSKMDADGYFEDLDDASDDEDDEED